MWTLKGYLLVILSTKQGNNGVWDRTSIIKCHWYVKMKLQKWWYTELLMFKFGVNCLVSNRFVVSFQHWPENRSVLSMGSVWWHLVGACFGHLFRLMILSIDRLWCKDDLSWPAPSRNSTTTKDLFGIQINHIFSLCHICCPFWPVNRHLQLNFKVTTR